MFTKVVSAEELGIPKLELIGSYTGNQDAINVSSVARSSDTEDNFIIVVTSVDAFDTGKSNVGTVSGTMGVSASGANPSLTFDAENKTVTTTGMTYTARASCSGGGSKTGTGTITYKLYHF